MVRMSKQKQDKLESIMHLVEQLGIDRVLGRLRQTRMMSKDVLDDMKEWETDYEKRVALLGFLVSPEGKRAFGALYELSKVHEEQLKLQEEQEKLRQEQLAQQQQPADLRKFGSRGKASAGGVNMKSKLRAQLAKRRDPPTATPTKPTQGEGPPGSQPPQMQPIITPAPPISKSGKRSPAGANLKKGGNAEAEVEGSKLNQEVGGQPKMEETAKNSEKATKEKEIKSPSPILHGRIRKTSENQPGTSGTNVAENSLDLSLTGSAVTQPAPSSKPGTPETSRGTPELHREQEKENGETKDDVIVEAEADGEWGKKDSQEIEVSEEDDEQAKALGEDRAPPDGENADDAPDEAPETGTQIKKVRISNIVKVVEVRDSAPNSPPATNSTPVIKRRKLLEIHQKLLNNELSVDTLTMDQIKEIVTEWQIMKKDHQGVDSEYVIKELQHTKDDLKKMGDEKDRIRKEKDKYVFKEFELQQKLQDLSSKYKSLRDDHESLKQGNYQIQQNTKKNNKIHQEMRKKIAKLESKIKSMDKVTARKATQTTEVFDKDVHEALRTAEENLVVVQAELKEATTKCKAAQQEAEDLKKQLNAKGREINKRERKSKKDEETIRLITRERDSMETKLRKVTEQLEYYRGMLEIRAKGGKRQLPEKKEVRVQRCSSGRHVLLKTSVAANCHQKDEDVKGQSKTQETEDARNGATRSGRNSLTNGNAVKQTRPNVASTKPQQVTQPKKQPSELSTQSKTISTTSKTSGGTTTSSSTAKTSTTNGVAKSAPSNTNKSSSSNNENKTMNNKTSTSSQANNDSNKAANTATKPVGSDSPSNAKKHVSFTPTTGQKPALGSTSPQVGPRQAQKSEEKLVRPKAATVRPTNVQTKPANTLTNTQKKLIGRKVE